MSKVPRYVNLLISQRDDQSHRLAIFGIGNCFFTWFRGEFVIFFGFGGESSNRAQQGCNSETSTKRQRDALGEFSRLAPLVLTHAAPNQNESDSIR